jgi:hypothetical protein
MYAGINSMNKGTETNAANNTEYYSNFKFESLISKITQKHRLCTENET